MQQSCRNCGAPLHPNDSVCASCGMPVQSPQPAVSRARPPSATPVSDDAQRSGPPVRSASTPKPSKPRRRRGLLLYVLLCILLVVVITIISTLVAVIGNSNAAQQPPTTGAHITSIETGTGFDTEKSLVTGVTHTFKTGQAVYVVFTVKHEDANAQIVPKLFQDSTLESTSDILTPDIGTNTYAFPIVVHSTGLHSCHLEYNHSTEATISFNVTL